MLEILFVPSLLHGNGTGHLIRCFSLVASLGNIAAIYLPDTNAKGWSHDELRLAYNKETRAMRVLRDIPDEAKFKLIVLDNRDTDIASLLFWKKHGCVVAIDEGGESRPFVPYLIDILPTQVMHKTKANITGLGFMTLPNARRKPNTLFKKILVSFGGEDPANLANILINIVLQHKLIEPKNIHVVSGAMSKNTEQSGVEYFSHIQDFKEKLSTYDLVITQFGLTAFEAAWAGCAVLLLNPSKVHQKLSQKAGFYSLGLGKQCQIALKNALKAALSKPELIIKLSQEAAPKERLNLSALIQELKPVNNNTCPSCGHELCKAIYRDAAKTYFTCPKCSMCFMVYFNQAGNPYVNDDYFNAEYKAQYGKTYIEDIPNIRLMAHKRLKVIEAIVKKAESSLFDIGCAYGAFVAEAEAMGWNVSGTDISASAVDYVKSTFKIPAFVSDFTSTHIDGFYPRNVDVITMWYVIEHFPDLAHILLKVGKLLKKGGLFAFSTPSLTGISGKKNINKFLSQSPNDHYTVWSPSTAKIVLKRFGFEVKKIVVTGHHPERFLRKNIKPSSIFYKLGLSLSKLFALGDTFECYAIYTGKLEMDT